MPSSLLDHWHKGVYGRGEAGDLSGEGISQGQELNFSLMAERSWERLEAVVMR